MSVNKIISHNEFKVIREKLKSENIKVIHCHGAFDLLHPGHITHLEEAKNIGGILVVSITSAPFINKGPGRPYFSDELRMKSLAALACVDYVLLAEEPAAFGIIDLVKPDYYVKGSEYANYQDDVTKNIEKEINAVKKHGGDIYFTGGEVFSSTNLINKAFGVFPPDAAKFAREFTQKHTFNDFKNMIDALSKLKVLVIGDIIIDEYIFCHVQGLMTKDRAFSSKYLNEQKYLGGTLAIARHIANFSDNVTVCSMMGPESHLHTKLLNELGTYMRLDIQFDDNFRTIIKRRFVERHGKRDQYEKLFSINYLDNFNPEKVDKQSFYKKLEDIIKNYDIVVLSDFGHGLIDKPAMDIIQKEAKYLAVNCQTNSSNYGMNLFTKYTRADSFTLDERELRLAYASKDEDIKLLVQKLKSHLNAKNGWVTLGSVGAYGVSENNACSIPALTLSVVDTVGAGDAYFALGSLCSYIIQNDIGLPTLAANIAGAIAANILGNSKSVSKIDVFKFANAFLK